MTQSLISDLISSKHTKIDIPRILGKFSPGTHPLTEKPEYSGYKIACAQSNAKFVSLVQSVMDRCFISDLKTCSIFLSIVIVSISYIFTAIIEMKIFLKVTFISPRIKKVTCNKLKPGPAKVGRQTVPQPKRCGIPPR